MQFSWSYSEFVADVREFKEGMYNPQKPQNPPEKKRIDDQLLAFSGYAVQDWDELLEESKDARDALKRHIKILLQCEAFPVHPMLMLEELEDLAAATQITRRNAELYATCVERAKYYWSINPSKALRERLQHVALFLPNPLSNFREGVEHVDDNANQVMNIIEYQTRAFIPRLIPIFEHSGIPIPKKLELNPHLTNLSTILYYHKD